MKKRIIAALLAVVMILGVCSCKKADKNEIKIGAICCLTGEVAVYGAAARNGMQLYIDEFNEAGGIDGKKIKLIVYDDKGDPTEAINAYNKLVTSDEVNAIIGPIISPPTLAVMQQSASDNIPIITPTATHKDVTSFGKNAFRACYTDDVQAISDANFAAQWEDIKTAGVIYGNEDPYSTGLQEVFVSRCQELGVEITAIEGYSSADVDYKSQLTNIIGTNPDVIYIPDYYNTVYTICKQARELGYQGLFLGVDGVDGVLTIEGADVSLVEGLHFTNHYAADSGSELVNDFIAKYEKAYGETPNALSALSYDAGAIMCEAISKCVKAGTKMDASPECYQAIIDAIESIEFSGVTGNIKFDENHNTIKTCMILKVEDGKYVSVGQY